MKVHLVKLSSDIVEDHYELGAGKSTGCGYSNEPVGKTFESFEAMLKYLADYYGLSSDANDYENEDGKLYTSKTVANHSEAQNGGWFEPTEAELEAWTNGELMLYSEDYVIEYHYVR